MKNIIPPPRIVGLLWDERGPGRSMMFIRRATLKYISSRASRIVAIMA